MNEKERGIILHSLGLLRRKRWSYRNYFAGCPELCEPLVAKGWMCRGVTLNRDTTPMPVYHVTNAGADAAGVLDRVRKQDRYKWWRGHDHTTEVFCQMVHQSLQAATQGPARVAMRLMLEKAKTGNRYIDEREASIRKGARRSNTRFRRVDGGDDGMG